MRKTGNLRSTDRGRLAINIRELMEALSCGRATAERIGKDAGAEIRIGRRKLYSTEKIRDYLSQVSGNTK